MSINSFVSNQDSYSVIKDTDSKAGVFTFRLKIHKEPPLIQWSLVIGDCIHNARSALDYLFWALVLLKNPDGIKDPTIQFPILRDPATFKGRYAKIEKWVGQPAATMIERMQPYNGAGPDKNALLFIHQSDITDKHKLLLPLLGAAEQIETTLELVNENTPIPHIDTELRGDTLENNAIIAIIRVPPDTVMNVDFNASINIIFKTNAPGVFIVVPSLEGLISVVESVAEDFALFFTQSSDTPP